MVNVAVIPARGGSKSIKLKNIKLFCNKPLLVWSIEACLNSGVFDEVWVSTDHKDIAQVAEANGARVHWRSEESGRDEASTESVMVDFCNAHGEWDVLACVQATSPLTQAQHFVDAMRAFQRNTAADSLVTVTRQHRFRWTDAAISAPLNYDPVHRPRRQEWNGELHENGAFYFVTREAWAASPCRVGKTPTVFEMPSFTAYEIDEPYDWLILESIMQRLHDRVLGGSGGGVGGVGGVGVGGGDGGGGVGNDDAAAAVCAGTVGAACAAACCGVAAIGVARMASTGAPAFSLPTTPALTTPLTAAAMSVPRRSRSPRTWSSRPMLTRAGSSGVQSL
eukprot:m.81215 g.81215  ORF g.81215 m.81215 type:complete len:336 (-) comp14686_c1_seq2:693-1700(-)